jgi:hypothetical protein
MLTIQRQILHLFKTLARRAGVKPSHQQQTPQLLLQSDTSGSRLLTASRDARLEYDWPETLPERVSWPLAWDLLEECGAKRPDSVTLAPDGNKLVQAQWSHRGIPQRQNFEIFPEQKLPGTLREAPPTPTSAWTVMSAEFWPALAEAVTCADDDSARYALGCLQLRGKTGDLNATDGRHVLQHGGFTFPWQDDLLVPATKILGAKELAGEETPQLAQTDDWLLLRLGPWTIGLRIEKAGRFPQIESIMPNASRLPTKLVLADADADFLRQALTALPGRVEQHHPVTLDLNGHVAVRGQENLQTPPTELILSQSRREGDQICVNLNREFLAQAVRLGFREIQFGNAKSPALCLDERRKYLFALLDAESAIRPTPDMLTIQSIAPQTVSSKPTTSRPTTIPMSKTNRLNTAPMTVQPLQVSPSTSTQSATQLKPIEAAIALRDLLRETLDKTTQLIMALKQQKKQSRLMQSTLASLKQLQAVA